MANLKNLLIVERSSGSLEVSGESKDYVLEGIFGEIDSKNKNNRIYTEDEYVPQIEALQNKIKSSKLLGELDHPQQFDVSLKNVSHIIEDLFYDKENKQVKGRIRLLDTDAGRQAKALVDAGVPLQISSRAAGTVESNGKVKIKQLFTYDLVADPGFENAELSRVNESYGFSNDGNLFIYEVGETHLLETNLNQNNTKKMEEFVNANDFNKYTEYLAEEIKSLKDSIDEVKTGISESANKNVESKIQDVIAHNDHLVENINRVTGYVQYLAEQLDKNIQYSEYVAEKADQGIQYAEHIAEKLDQSIQYAEHIAEKTDQAIQYSEHVAEKSDQGIQYTEAVAESVNKLKEYAEYIAQSANEGFNENDKLIEYVNYLKENLESVTHYAEYIAESINENLVLESEVSKDAEKATIPAEDLKANLKKSDSEIEDTIEDSENPAKGDVGEDGAYDPLEAYKANINSKLETLVESALIKENTNPSFFRIVSSSTQSKYNQLNEEAKKEVRQAVAKRGFMTEAQIVSLIESSQLIVENRNAQPFVIEAMPVEYKEKWESLSESKQAQILAQSQYFNLNTEYQVANFWQTRDLRESKPNMERLEMVNEKKSVQEETKPMYDISNYAEELKKRFKK
jgi:hypothetical protein